MAHKRLCIYRTQLNLLLKAVSSLAVVSAVMTFSPVVVSDDSLVWCIFIVCRSDHQSKWWWGLDELVSYSRRGAAVIQWCTAHEKKWQSRRVIYKWYAV